MTTVVVVVVSGQPVFLQPLYLLLRQSPCRLRQPGRHRGLVRRVPALRGRPLPLDLEKPVGTTVHEAQSVAALEDGGELL